MNQELGVQVEEDEVDSGIAGFALRANHLSKTYGSTRVLDDVSFDVVSGEIHALMGENGAGKSTLINILAGVADADSGEIDLNGESVSIRSSRDAAALGIGVVFQELSLIPNLTVAENLFLGRELHSGPYLDRKRMNAQSTEILARLGLSIDPDTLVENLDVAEQQAVEICKVLAQDARVLILDEPTAALTESERERLFVVLLQLRESGMAIIYVSHHLGEISRLADRVTVLRNGRRMFCRRMSETTEDEIVLGMLNEALNELFPSAPLGKADDGETVLALTDVHFGQRLGGVDLTVRRGEVVGVTGLLGAGQRELGRIAAGKIDATAGTVRRTGSTVRFVPGDRKGEGLALELTGAVNLTVYVLREISKRILGASFLLRGRERRFVDSAAAELGVRGDVDGPVGSLSGGNQQKLLLGRAIQGKVDLLVLEEPTRGVDVGARVDLYRLIRKVADAGCGVLVVSTDLREVAGLSDSVVVIDGGTVAARFTREEASEAAIYAATHSTVQDASVQRAPVTTSATRARQRFTSILRDEALVPWLAFALIVVVSAIVSPVFTSAHNWQSLLQQSVPIGIVGLGQLFVILSRNIDLSIGGVVSITNIVGAQLMIIGTPFWLACVIALAIGGIIGIVNAVLVLGGIPSLLETYAMGTILGGVILMLFAGSIGPVPGPVVAINGLNVFGVSLFFIGLVVLWIVAALALRHTRWGLHVFATGGDPRGARLSGIRTKLVTASAFLLSGMLAALAGLYLITLTGGGSPTSGTGNEINAIVVVMIGGASLLGGRGTVRGMVAGVGIVTILANIMNLTGVNAFLQRPIEGAIIIAVGVVWSIREHRRRVRIQLSKSS